MWIVLQFSKRQQSFCWRYSLFLIVNFFLINRFGSLTISLFLIKYSQGRGTANGFREKVKWRWRDVESISEQKSQTAPKGAVWARLGKDDGEFGMVLSEDEVFDGEVLWRVFKCSHSTFVSTSSFRSPLATLSLRGWPTFNLNHRGTSKKVHGPLAAWKS